VYGIFPQKSDKNVPPIAEMTKQVNVKINEVTKNVKN